MNRISNFAERLKEYRQSQKMTLHDLEKITKVPAQTLNRYELGQRVPKIDAAIEISEALNIDPLWLQGYDVIVDNVDISPKSSIFVKPRPKPTDSSMPIMFNAGLDQETLEHAEVFQALDPRDRGELKGFANGLLTAGQRDGRYKPLKSRFPSRISGGE